MIRLLQQQLFTVEIAFVIEVVLFLKIVATITKSRASDYTTPHPQAPLRQLQQQQPPQQLQLPQLQRVQQHQQQAPRQLLQQPQRQQHRCNRQAKFQNKLNLGFLSNFSKN